MRLIHVLLAILLPRVVGSTPCEECCSPGGSCASAYKQGPGICCGTSGSQSFCCPTPMARCFKCKSGLYRCYASSTSEPSCGICAPGDDPRSRCTSSTASSPWPPFIVAIIFIALFACCLCAKAQRRFVPSSFTGPYNAAVELPGAYQTPVAQGYPCGQPMPQSYQQPYQQPFQPSSQPYYQYVDRPSGFSGGTVAGAAGVGFIGGMMVGEALGSNHHHRHSSSDFGGGDYGGSDFGGGDAGFAADN